MKVRWAADIAERTTEILENQCPSIFTTRGHYEWDFSESVPGT